MTAIEARIQALREAIAIAEDVEQRYGALPGVSARVIRDRLADLVADARRAGLLTAA